MSIQFCLKNHNYRMYYIIIFNLHAYTSTECCLYLSILKIPFVIQDTSNNNNKKLIEKYLFSPTTDEETLFCISYIKKKL